LDLSRKQEIPNDRQPLDTCVGIQVMTNLYLSHPQPTHTLTGQRVRQDWCSHSQCPGEAWSP